MKTRIRWPQSRLHGQDRIGFFSTYPSSSSLSCWQREAGGKEHGPRPTSWTDGQMARMNILPSHPTAPHPLCPSWVEKEKNRIPPTRRDSIHHRCSGKYGNRAVRDSRRVLRRIVHMHVPVQRWKGGPCRGFLGVRYEYEVWFDFDRSIDRSSELNE